MESEDWVKKYGLEGKGVKTRISKRTQEIVKALTLKSKAQVLNSKASAILDTTRYGGK